MITLSTMMRMMVTKINKMWWALGGIRSDHSIENGDEDDDGDEDQNHMVGSGWG